MPEGSPRAARRRTAWEPPSAPCLRRGRLRHGAGGEGIEITVRSPAEAWIVPLIRPSTGGLSEEGGELRYLVGREKPPACGSPPAKRGERGSRSGRRWGAAWADPSPESLMREQRGMVLRSRWAVGAIAECHVTRGRPTVAIVADRGGARDAGTLGARPSTAQAYGAAQPDRARKRPQANTEIAAALGCHPVTRQWRRRFDQMGWRAERFRARAARSATQVGFDRQERLELATAPRDPLVDPLDGRRAGHETAISGSGAPDHRTSSSSSSCHPQFIDKVRDVAGLSTHPGRSCCA